MVLACLPTLGWAETDTGDDPSTPVTAPAAQPAATIYATATVRERPVDDAMAAVSVEGQDTAAALGALDVAEILRFVPGLYSPTSGAVGGPLAIQIRGGDPNFTRVLIDGVPVNDGTYQVGGVFDFEALPADGVERVEVVRGPLSAHFGSTGLAGAIQVITRGGSGPARADLRLTAGDAELRRGALSLGGGAGRTGGFVSLVAEEEEGRVAEEGFELFHLQGRGSRRFGEAGELSLSARLADWQGEDYPEASGGPLFGSGELRQSRHDEASLGLRLAWGPSSRRWQRAEAAVYRHRLGRESPAIVPLVPASEEENRFTRVRLGWASSSLAASRPGRSVEFSYGADLDWEDGRSESLLLLPPFLGGAVAGDYSLDRASPGVFGQVSIRRGAWTLDLGLRADFPETPDGGSFEELSPRLALARVLGPNTRLRASLGRAFKLPSFFALASPPALGGNPRLQPEIMLGGDLGVETAFPELGLRVSANAFVNRYEDLVDFDFETFLHLNRSRVDAIGAELGLGWTPTAAFSAAAHLAWQEVEDQATGRVLRHRPRWVGGLRLDWRGNARIRLGADWRFTSASRDEQIPVPDLERVGGHGLFALVASGRITPSLKATLRLDNVGDRDYQTRVGFPGPGRSVRLSLAWAFGGPKGRRTSQTEAR